MATQLKNGYIVTGVIETTQTTGTGTLDLDGSQTGYKAFVDLLNDGDVVYYEISDDPAAPTEYEVGYGAFNTGSPNTLTRTTVIQSSNAGSKISLSAGTTYTVTGVLPAEALGTAAGKDTGTDPGEVPLNSDLGSAAVEDVATGGTGDLLREDGDGSQITNLTGTNVSKAWAYFGTSGVLNAGYNVSSITDSATGEATVSFSTALSSPNHSSVVSALTTTNVFAHINGKSPGSVDVQARNTDNGSLTDPIAYNLTVFGDRS